VGLRSRHCFAGDEWTIAMRAAASIAACLVMPLCASAATADGFHPAMVQAGLAKPGDHVDFSPPFPAAPAVTLMPTQHMNRGDVPEACSAEAANVSAAGFDYSIKCNFTAEPPALWIAILSQ
jgi:hypothetical protein